MIEERFRRIPAEGDLTSSYTFDFRIRNRIRYIFQVVKDLKMEIGSEIFFNAGRAGLDPFDQHRTTLLAQFNLGKVRMSTGYMHWAILVPSGTLENRHSWVVSANHTIDWTD